MTAVPDASKLTEEEKHLVEFCDHCCIILLLVPGCSAASTQGNVHHAAAALREALQRVDGEADLDELQRAAGAAAATGQQLAHRQADTFDAVSQELLCSPEIVR